MNNDDQIVTLQLTPLEDTDKLEGEKNTAGQVLQMPTNSEQGEQADPVQEQVEQVEQASLGGDGADYRSSRSDHGGDGAGKHPGCASD
ncbi:hypothetical protein QTP86_001580 [Hemibagrus guttatus]|nr:hypothetical protein QTP86_001580 [Hemibagrus guttatus]